MAAASHGLPPSWVEALRVASASSSSPPSFPSPSSSRPGQALGFVAAPHGSGACGLLAPGDILLSVDGATVSSFADVEAAVARRVALLALVSPHPSPLLHLAPLPPSYAVDATVWRCDGVSTLRVPLAPLSCVGTDRVVTWQGAQIQAPHRGIKELGFVPEGEAVFVSRWHNGSPADRFGA